MSDAAASMIGPRHYRDLVLPWQRRTLQAVHDAHPGVILRQHMCGNVDDLIAQMATLPVDIYELDFPTDLTAARAGLGPDRVLGNVSTITYMLTGTPQDVQAACLACLETCGPYHIVGAGCELSPFTPPENLHAMVRFAAEHTPGALPVSRRRNGRRGLSPRAV